MSRTQILRNVKQKKLSGFKLDMQSHENKIYESTGTGFHLMIRH